MERYLTDEESQIHAQGIPKSRKIITLLESFSHWKRRSNRRGNKEKVII